MAAAVRQVLCRSEAGKAQVGLNQGHACRADVAHGLPARARVADRSLALPACWPLLACCSYEDFLWALENVRSRAFSGPYTGSSGGC